MTLSELCIRRPVLATVLSLVLVVLGLNGYLNLPLRFFPKMNVPTMQINTYYQGASPDAIETNVTIPIENELSSIPGIESLYSTSSNSWSRITVNFKLGVDFNALSSEARNRAYAARKYMPADADLPTISTGGSGDNLLVLGIEDTKLSPNAIRDYVSRNLIAQIRQVSGVGSVSISGSSNYAMRIWLDSRKMAQLGVTVSDVKAALQSNNIEFPAGTILDPKRSFSVVSRTRLHSVKQFANIIVDKKGSRLIRFKDFATVKIGTASFQSYPMRINGKSGIIVKISSLKGSNPLSVAAAVKKQLGTIRKGLPTGMTMQAIYDQSIYLKSGLEETFKAIFEAIILVILVVYAFLGNLRASMIPIVTIPLCIIGVFGFMDFLGFSINVMTLLAIVLAIGLVVDDAIVMLENIHRYIEQGMEPMKAAITGSKEITSAVIAMTITLAAVYAPVGLSQGFTAAIFRQFAFTLTLSVLISGFVALTLSPMMCARLISAETEHSRFSQWLENRFNRLALAYKKLLGVTLHHRRSVLLILIGILGVGGVVFYTLSSEFIPPEDIGILSVGITSPSGANIDYTVKYMKQITALTNKIPDVKDTLTWIYSGSAHTMVILKPWYQRKITTDSVIANLRPKLNNIPGINTSISLVSPITYGKGGSDFNIYLTTAGSYQSLIPTMEKITAALKRYPGLINIDRGLKFNSQQYALTINRDLAGQLGVNIQDIADTVHVMLGGMHITDFMQGSQSYDVLVQMQKKDLENFNGIKKLYVHGTNVASSTSAVSSAADEVPLASLVSLTPIVGQESLRHYNHMRASWIQGQLAPGYTIGDVVNYTQQLLPTLLPPTIHYAFTGKAEQYLQSSGNMLQIVLLAIVFIYLILAAQFESFIDPCIILFTVPLSVVGALVALKFSGGALSVYSEIGLVTLIGLISKHGILITQFVNETRARGVALEQAIIEGASTRLRPIIMTTAAMVLGSVPLVLANGPGAAGRAQIGWVIIGGLLVGTFFSLFVVPVAYHVLSRFKR